MLGIKALLKSNHESIKGILLSGLFLIGFALIFILLYDELDGRYIVTARGEVRNASIKEENVKIVSLGSSHAANNVKPEWFSSPMVSFASPGQDLFETAYKADAALKMFPRLKIVLISMSYFSFFYDNGKYKGPDARIGRRIDMYARFWGGVPGLSDLSYFMKGRLGNIITRDHLEWYFLRQLGFESMIPRSRYLMRKPGDNRWQFRFDGDEDDIPHRLYLNLDDHITLVGYSVDHERLMTCQRGAVIWYWYCRKKIPEDLTIQSLRIGDQKIEALSDPGDFIRFFPLSVWKEGTIVRYMQLVPVPSDWTAKTMTVAVRVRRNNVPSPLTDLVTEEIDWPTFELEYPVRPLTPALPDSPALVHLYKHSCIRSQTQSDIIDGVLAAHPDVIEDSYKTLKSTVNQLKNAGIKPIIYTAPFHRAYNARFRKRCQDTMHARMTQLVNETGVDYYDFSRDKRFEDNASLFQNTDHLAPNGAKIFSQILNDIVMKQGHL